MLIVILGADWGVPHLLNNEVLYSREALLNSTRSSSTHAAHRRHLWDVYDVLSSQLWSVLHHRVAERCAYLASNPSFHYLQYWDESPDLRMDAVGDEVVEPSGQRTVQRDRLILPPRQWTGGKTRVPSLLFSSMTNVSLDAPQRLRPAVPIEEKLAISGDGSACTWAERPFAMHTWRRCRREGTSITGAFTPWTHEMSRTDSTARLCVTL